MKHLIPTVAACALLIALATFTGCPEKTGQTEQVIQAQQAVPASNTGVAVLAEDIALIKGVVLPAPLTPEQKAVIDAKTAAAQADRKVLETEATAAKATADAALKKAQTEPSEANIAAARKAGSEAIAAQQRVEGQTDEVLASTTAAFSKATTAKEMMEAFAQLGSTGRKAKGAQPATAQAKAPSTGTTPAGTEPVAANEPKTTGVDLDCPVGYKLDANPNGGLWCVEQKAAASATTQAAKADPAEDRAERLARYLGRN